VSIGVKLNNHPGVGQDLVTLFEFRRFYRSTQYCISIEKYFIVDFLTITLPPLHGMEWDYVCTVYYMFGELYQNYSNGDSFEFKGGG
jgi:hypothetical protein